MKLPPLEPKVAKEITFSSDQSIRTCVHELALAIARVIYGEDAVTYGDTSPGARNYAHEVVQEIADLPHCQARS